MSGHLFITQGDITRFRADVLCVTWGLSFDPNTPNFARLVRLSDGDLTREYASAWARAEPGRTAFAVPLSRERKPRAVVFVSPHRQDRPRAVFDSPHDTAYLVVKEALEAAVAALPPADPAQAAERPLIALVAFRMGLGGDRNKRLGAARAQIRAAFEALDAHPHLDLAFVVDEPTKYEIFLEARRKERASRGEAQPPPLASDPRLAELVGAIQCDEAVLFVGAGMSVNSGVTGYGDLIRELAGALGMAGEVTDDLDAYLDIAQCYRDAFPGRDLDALIESHFGAKTRHALPSLAHSLLLSLPIRFIVTTNYDSLLEDTLEGLKRYPLRVTSAEQVARTGYRDGTFVVKFHGDAGEGRVVLSRDDYDAFFRDRPEMAALLEGLLLNQTFFFVGYSLRDPNFRQIHAKIDLLLSRARRPAYIASLEHARPFVRQQYARRRLHLIDLKAPESPAPPASASSDPAPAPLPDLGLTSTGSASRNFLLFLDRLAEEVTGRSRLLLAPDGGDAPDAMRPVCDALNQLGYAVADTIIHAGKAIRPEDARTLNQSLGLLCGLGWRPTERRVSLTRLFSQLAEALSDEASDRELRQLYLSALRHAESSDVAASLRAKVAALEAPPEGEAS
jgi:hypothetical protein